MTTRPLHLIGTMADAIAPFIARLGVPVTTEAPTTPDAPQLHCHTRLRGNPITDGGNLWKARHRAPEGLLASWAAEPESGNREKPGVYEVMIRESHPSVQTGTGVTGLLEALQAMGYHPTLTLDAIIPPYPDPDPAPAMPPDAIRHTTTLPVLITDWAPNRHISNVSIWAQEIFWQLSPELRDTWLVHPTAQLVLKDLHGRSPNPVDAMIWHRGSDTTPAIKAHFAAKVDTGLRRSYLQGLAHWGAPEELNAAHELRNIDPSLKRGEAFRLRHLKKTLEALDGASGLNQARAHERGGLAILRLLERDPAFRDALLNDLEEEDLDEALRDAAQIILGEMTQRLVVKAPHPARTPLEAYNARKLYRPQQVNVGPMIRLPDGGATPVRDHEQEMETAMDRLAQSILERGYGQTGGGAVFTLPEDTPYPGTHIGTGDNVAEALGRLTETAAIVRGSIWRENDTVGQLEAVVRAWGSRATAADDFAMADWLQSFRGPVGLLARVANGVLAWPTLTPATVTGITRARAVSKSVESTPVTEELIKRIPHELVPDEWRTISAATGQPAATHPPRGR